MATQGQARFIRENRDLLADPVLIIGSHQYPYDAVDLRVLLGDLGMADITGVDIVAGAGVDAVVDITQPGAFLEERRAGFGTVLCMEVLTNVDQPFHAAEHATALLRNGGAMFLSEVIVRKLSRMPQDHWRFTYTGTQLLFSQLDFDHTRARMSFTRDRDGALFPVPDQLPAVTDERHPDETAPGYLLRRIHRRYLARGVFRLSRLLPESTIYSVATKESTAQA